MSWDGFPEDDACDRPDCSQEWTQLVPDPTEQGSDMALCRMHYLEHLNAEAAERR